MTTATQKLSALEFLALPEVQGGAWLELVNGEPIVCPRPSMEHSFACIKLAQILSNHLTQSGQGVIFFELDTIFDQESVRAPDLVYYTSARVPRGKKYNDVVPDLCIEFLSPSNARSDRIEKFELYEAKGVSYYWIISPEERTIEAYALANGKFANCGRGHDAQVVKLPPFATLEIPLAELWFH